MSLIPNVLTIAGSDSSGGAGVQADLKTFGALGVYGMSVITALTAQNTVGVRSVVSVPARFVRDQIDAVFDDVDVSAVKIGMLASADIINAVADSLEEYKPDYVVLDPVMVSTSGDVLIDIAAIDAMKNRLFPLVNLITPNIPEAEKLLRKAVLDMEVAAQGLCDMGVRGALLKGGHLKGDVMRDVLVHDGVVKAYEAPRVVTRNTHGTGCTLSSAIAAYLAHGLSVDDACGRAKTYLTGALKSADMLNVGSDDVLGHGPVHHFHAYQNVSKVAE